MTGLHVRQIAGLGWRPDTPDIRDRVWRPKAAIGELPDSVDLCSTGFMPPVYSQGALGSCTANAIAAAYEFEQRRQGQSDFMPSRLFIYYGEREIENTISIDCGAEIRDGIKVINRLGVPDETVWPYEIGKFADKPSQEAYDAALKHQTISYASINVEETPIELCLASGTPIICGLTVYHWFTQPGPGGRLYPTDEVEIIGGHAILIVGYLDIGGARHVKIRNSWGLGYGEFGYCYMPMTWLCQDWHAQDFWAITEVAA